MTHGSICSGIGGFDIAARKAGIKNRWACEIDPYCRKVLAKNFPESKIYGDIRTTDWGHAEPVDIITAGFPCQPFSNAGKQLGAADDRHLWPDVFGAVSTLRPYWFIGENVPGLARMGLDAVLSDLENEGYACQTFDIPACAVGAWHKRHRLWIVAHTHEGYRERADEALCSGRHGLGRIPGQGPASNADRDREQQPQGQQPKGGRRLDNRSAPIPAHATGIRQPRSRHFRKSLHTTPRGNGQATEPEHGDWWQAYAGVRGIPDGISAGVDPARTERLHSLGNTIVPQVARVLFEAIRSISEK